MCLLVLVKLVSLLHASHPACMYMTLPRHLLFCAHTLFDMFASVTVSNAQSLPAAHQTDDAACKQAVAFIEACLQSMDRTLAQLHAIGVRTA